MDPQKVSTEVKTYDCVKPPIFPLLENFTKRQLLLLPEHLGVPLPNAVIGDKAKMPACDVLADPFLEALHSYRALTTRGHLAAGSSSPTRTSSSVLSEAAEPVEEQPQAGYGL